MWKTAKLFGLLSALLAAMIFFTSCRAEETREIIVPVTVKTGDTLDGILIRVADEYGDRRDYREIRYHVKADNGKTDSAIFPGEALNIRLVVPVKEKTAGATTPAV